MKLTRHIYYALATVAVMAFHCIPAPSKNVVMPKSYMFGFCASFNDSTVYFTPIQEVDSVWVTQKKKLLAGRSNYSSQLRDYFTDVKNMPKRTCIVVSSLKRKDVEKKYEKMKKLYTSPKKGRNYEVYDLSADEFQFRAVNMDDSQEEQAVEKKKEKKPKNNR